MIIKRRNRSQQLTTSIFLPFSYVLLHLPLVTHRACKLKWLSLLLPVGEDVRRKRFNDAITVIVVAFLSYFLLNKDIVMMMGVVDMCDITEAFNIRAPLLSARRAESNDGTITANAVDM